MKRRPEVVRRSLDRDEEKDRRTLSSRAAALPAATTGQRALCRDGSAIAGVVAEELKIVGLVTRSDRLEMISKRRRVELVCRAIDRVGIEFGLQLAHECRRK
jgi:hypothetical protein